MNATHEPRRQPPVPLVQSPMRRLTCLTLLAISFFAGVGSFGVSPAHGQAAWEYSPYEVKIWLICDPAVIPGALQTEIARSLAQRGESVHGAAWSVEVSSPPTELRSLAGLQGDKLSLEAIEDQSPETLSVDKLILVSIAPDDGAFTARVRELDCRTRQWSSTFERTAADRAGIALAAWDAVMRAFTPIARIESVDGRNVVAQLRAAGLVTDPDSPLLVRAEDVLRPVIRRNDRIGKLARDGIQTPDWTLLRVTRADQTKLQCQLVSGFRSPIPTKGGQRTDRLALLVRPAWPQTRLVIQSRTRPARPLGGYDIYRRGIGEEEPQFLGSTAADGSFVLPATDGRLQPLLVRSGTQLLARLPIVPGQAPELVANVIDDDGRLQAEGFVLAFQSRVMDLVARRELLAATFRKQLEAGELDAAQDILEEYRLLETRADLTRVLDQQQQEISTRDRVTELRIQRLFSDARKLLLRFLDPDTANAMARDLAAARARPAAATPASTTGDKAGKSLAAPSRP